MESRPVRIYFATDKNDRDFVQDSYGSLVRAIKQVLSTVGNESSHLFVETVDEADLVVFTEIRSIERGYDKNKTYAYLQTGSKVTTTLPENCLVINTMAGNALVAIIETINKARQLLKPIVEAPVVQEETTPFLPNALRILVIDDKPANIASAKKTLAGHLLTSVTGYEDAMNILAKGKFDVVLTDLHLPMSSKMLGDKAFKLGELVPYGILLMIEAARQGAKYVAVVTDLSHHADPFSAAFDHYSRFPVNIEGAKVVMMHAPMAQMDGKWVKEWSRALDLIKR